MARIPFSVRFPLQLVETLDGLATRRGTTRSDLVEAVIEGIDEEDRVAILKTAPTDAPIERRNLRLSAEALARLKQLAGGLEPSDFLRRAIAHALSLLPPEERERAAHVDAPTSAGRGSRTSYTRRRPSHEGVAFSHPQNAGLALIFVLFVVGALISLVVWLLCRRPEAPSPEPDNAGPGHISSGTGEVIDP